MRFRRGKKEVTTSTDGGQFKHNILYFYINIEYLIVINHDKSEDTT